MNVDDLTEPERKLWQAATTGALVDFRVGDPKADSPEKGTEWGPERKVRAEVIAALLIGDGDAASVAVRGVRLQGARIKGDLNLEAATLRCPFALLDCSFASSINLDEATALSVRLSGSHVPALSARQLQTRGDFRLDKGFSATGEVLLLGAHIGGQLSCTGGQFSNPGGIALAAEGLTVDGYVFCDDGFSAEGEVLLRRAHIAGQLICTGGQFSNPNGTALGADGLRVEGEMFCDKGFVATGEVRLLGAHIEEFACTGGQFSNPNGIALGADRFTVERSMYCDEGFVATGAVRLPGAHIGGQLSCTGGQFSNPNGLALNLEGATVNGSVYMASVVLQGTLDLTTVKVGSYYDDPAFWPETLRLEGFVYNSIEGASVKERLDWLRHNEEGYSPQIYDQLAAVYRAAGHDEDARRILIAKQRRRSAEGNLADKIWGWLLWVLVGYGYRTWLAVLWLVGLLIFGTYLFGYLHSAGELTPVNKPDVQPAFQPFLYTLDLLLPVVSLHVRDTWITHGAAQWWSVGFIIIGWILATAVVLSLTGLLKRD